MVRPVRRLRHRLRRRPRPGGRQAGSVRGGRGRPQLPDGRPARRRQDDARQADPDDPPAALRRRVDRDDPHLQRAGPDAAGPAAPGHAALPRAAPHDLRGRADRRPLGADAGRDLPGAQRRAVPRRASRVQPPHARGAAAAARGRIGDDQPGQIDDPVSGRLHARGRAQSLPLRLPRGSPPGVPVHRAPARALQVPFGFRPSFAGSAGCSGSITTLACGTSK